MNNKNIDKLVTEALAIEREEAYKAGAIGYMARALIQATMPHSKVDGDEFKRRNGIFKMSIRADSDIGLPYGSIPRLLIAWITTEAVKTKQKELVLGKTLAEFMAELDLIPSGGKWGSITRLKDQMKRLFSSSISCTYDDGRSWHIRNIMPIERADLWWNPKNPNQASLWESTLLLSDSFFNEITTSSVPIDMRALKALKQSAMALDIYCWLTYRMSYLKNTTTIPWGALQIQFGADYKELRQFKRRFLEQLKKVLVVYSEARVEEKPEGLTLRPSKPHIEKEIKLFVGNHGNLINSANSSNNSQNTLLLKEKRNMEKNLKAKYAEYRLNTLTEIIENLQDQSEKHTILKEFEHYLSRKRLHNIRSQIIKGIHSNEVKEELYNFVNSNWHHILAPIKSYPEFCQSSQ